MSGALEQRMAAMRTRLSHLSTTVDRNDTEMAEERRNVHRYYQDTPSSAPLTAPRATTAPLPALRERDANANAPLSSAGQKPQSSNGGSGVGAMLQLARKHTPATSGAQHHEDPLSFASSFIGEARKTAAAKTTPLTPSAAAAAAAAPLDFSGLRTYDFQERFPTPRRTPVDTPPPSPRQAPFGRGEGHRYAQGNVVSAQYSSVSVASDTSFSSAASTSEAPFDAFRAVQERLRNKMRQLTSAAPNAATTLTAAAATFSPASRPSALPPTAKRDALVNPFLDAADEPVSVAKTATTRFSRKKDYADEDMLLSHNTPQHLSYEDSSPPPRPPPGTRAETATPPRSPEKPTLASHNTTLAPASPLSAFHERDGRTPIEVELSGTHPTRADGGLQQQQQQSGRAAAARHALYDPDASEKDFEEDATRPGREYMYEDHHRISFPTASDFCGQLHRGTCHDIEEEEHVAAVQQRFTKGTVGTAPGAFSEPTSAARHPRLHSNAAPPVRSDVTTAGGARNVQSGSRRSLSRSQSGSAPQPRRSSTRPQSERHASSNSSNGMWRPRPSTNPSSSHPRERSSIGSQPQRGSAAVSAPRSKPISLNVEATILASVTGAELFALLRMRGLIDSEGDTEEYRLPPSRCHRLYVTADELRQLQLLRQSMQAMETEERTVPSYQRATVAARSRNAEFAPPPPVTHFMEH